MSFQAVRWALRQTLPTPGAKMLLVALADHANKAGECLVSQETLAEETCQSVRAVQVHLNAIEASGMIKIAEQYRRNKSQKSNRYRLLVEKQYAESAGCNTQNLQVGGQCAESAYSTPEQCAESAPLVPTVLEPLENTPPMVPPAETDKPKGWKKSKRCPAEWEPNDEHQKLARELGVNLEREVANMRDHEFKEARSDWDAVGRKWIRRASDYLPKRGAARNGMILPYDPTRRPEPAAPQKTRALVEHEERIRKAYNR